MMLTPFEDSGLATTRAGGESFLAGLAAAQQGITVQSYGNSVNGNPMTTVTIGGGPVKVAVLSSVHGTEPAGREAAFVAIRDLAETSDPALLAYLSTAAWTFLPTANPDNIDAGIRQNANGIDLNRDHMARTQPEAQAIYAWLQATQPSLVLDLHETTSGSIPDVAWGVQERLDIHPDLRAQSAAAKTAAEAALIAAGYGVIAYPFTAETEGTLRNEAGRIHYAAALLIETRSTRTLAARVARHGVAVWSVQEHHAANMGDYDTARAAALPAPSSGLYRTDGSPATLYDTNDRPVQPAATS